MQFQQVWSFNFVTSELIIRHGKSGQTHMNHEAQAATESVWENPWNPFSLLVLFGCIHPCKHT